MTATGTTNEMEYDFTDYLFPELIEKILRLLTPQELCRFSCVCVRWREVANNDSVWLHHCMVRGWMKYEMQYHILNEKPVFPKATNVAGTSPLFDLQVPSESELVPICKWKHVFLRVDHLLRNWDRSRYVVAPILRGHKEKVTCMDCNDRCIVTGCEGKLLLVWSMQTCSIIHRIKAHTDTVTAVKIKGNIIVTGCADSSVRVFDSTNGALLVSFMGHYGSVDKLAIIGSKIVSAATDRTLRIWCLESKRLFTTLRGHTDEIECMSVHKNKVLTGSWDKSLILWDVDTGESLHRCEGHKEMITCCQFDDIRMVSGSGDGDLRTWSSATGRCTGVFHDPGQAEVYCVAYNKEVIVAGYSDSAVRVWDHSGELQHVLREHLGIVRCLHLTDERLVSGGDQKKVVVWDYRKGRMISVLHRHPTRLHLMWVSQTKLVTASPERPGTVTVLSYW